MRGEFLWNDLVVAGMEDGTPFLGHIDKFGDTFKDCFVGTGYGLHIGLPELRKRWKEGLALEEAKTIMEETTRTLLLRVATTINSVSIYFSLFLLFSFLFFICKCTCVCVCVDEWMCMHYNV